VGRLRRNRQTQDSPQLLVSSPTPWECFQADRARCPGNPLFAWFAYRSLWAIATYRFGQAALAAPRRAKYILRLIHRMMLLTSQLATNIEINTRAQIGPGLRIHHAGPIIIGRVTMGSGCTIRPGNILGRKGRSEWPTLGDRVTLGAGAQVLGAVTIGDDVTVGAMSLVIHDIPADSVVAGIPARILR